MDSVSVVLAGIVGAELLACFAFASAFGRRPADREYGVAALLALASAAHEMGALGAEWAASDTTLLVAHHLARIGWLAALPLAVHFAIAYGGKRPRWTELAPPYALSALLIAVGPKEISPLAAVLHPASFSGVFVALFVGVVAVTILARVARTYLGGRRDALAVVVGSTMFLTATIHDVAVASGAYEAYYLLDAGLAAFVLSIVTTPSARYASVVSELERRTKELRLRTRELRKSYGELRTAQEELVKKEQLAAVGELAAVIAHEVRNPLAIISNAVAGLRKQGISREDHGTLLLILEEETNRLNRLVTDLLRYARPVDIQRQQFSLAEVLRRALGLARADRAGIRAELKLECHDAQIWGDANLLRQVFDNLVDNAVQAMGPVGSLTVRVRMSTEEGVDGLAVDISDTGEGMDTQVRSRARDPFFTTRPSGTGLGLAIVDRIVDAHGGAFAIQSRSGEGTTVTVFLPHGSASEPPAIRSRPSKPTLDPGSLFPTEPSS